MKLKVSNYQSIKSAEVELDGFVVVTGESNLGKSALLRALRGAVFGQQGDHFVHHGASHSVVTLIDSSTIEWQKVHKDRRATDLQTHLDVDGVVHERYGHDHEPILGKLGYKKIETAAGYRLPQFAFQHDPPFLISETPTVVAEVFKMLGRVDVITAAQTMSKKDLRETEQTRKLRTKDAEDAQLVFAAIQGLGELEGKFSDLTETCILAVQEWQRLNDVLSGAEQVHSLRTEILAEPPVLPRLGVQIAQLDGIKRGREIEDVLVPIPPALPDLDSLTSTLSRVEEVARLSQDGSPLLPPPATPVIPDTTSLDRIDALLGIKLPCLKDVRTKIKDAEEALAGYDVCPVCEGPLDEQHATGGAEA